MFNASRLGVVSLARNFVALHFLKNDMELLEKQFSALFEYYKTNAVPTSMEISGVTNVPLAEGFRVGTSSRLWVAVKPGAKEPAFAWLKENGLGDLIQPAVNTQTLSAAVKEQLEETNVEPPPDLFNVTLTQTTSVTSTKK
jgi:hypothetical protein